MRTSADSFPKLRRRLLVAAAAMTLAACGADPGGGTPAGAPDAAEALNMRLVGTHELQGRSAYQPVVHNYAGRYILFVGHHAGEAVDPLTGVTERNGMSILDVTDPAAPELLVHVPPSGLDANGTQHVQVCAGADLPNADPAMTYLVRTNGRLSYELWDVTDPAAPAFLATIAETGESSRRESARGTRETHKLQWECASGIGYFNGTPEGWRVTRVLQAFDLGNPAEPRHIRDFGLVGWEPTAQGPMPPGSISGLHQAFAHGDRLYLGYGSGNDGTLQIVDVDRFLEGNPNSDYPMLPTRDNLLYPQIARLDMPRYWGVHTAKPMLDVEVPGHSDDGAVRDFLIVASESGPGSERCRDVFDVVFMLDITEEDKPYPVASYEVPPEPGGFCERGGRFGPHSIQDELHANFDRTLMVVSYFNAGVRAVDIRNPFKPVEIGYFVPEITASTAEFCVTEAGVETCRQAIQTNNVNIDDRGYIYAVDRANTGLHIVELAGAAREIVGLE